MTDLVDTQGRVASAFEDRVDEIAAETADRMRREIDELRRTDVPELWEAVRRLTQGTRLTQAEHLRRGRELPRACPEPDAECARMAARAGVSVAGVEKSYRIGHSVSWGVWLDSVEQAGLEGGERKACLRAVSQFALSYDERLIELVTEEFMRARKRELRGRDRIALMRDLIEGVTESAADLDYELGIEHLGVVAWGENAGLSLQRLGVRLDRRLLMAEPSEGLFWAWFGGRALLDGDLRDRVACFEPEEGGRLAVGNPELGVEGFRRSHQQAGEAHLVALHRAQPVTLYADVSLEALALRDERVARDFMASELGALANGDRRAEQLRETIRCYFASGQNAASTAAALGVHEHTVARRLRTVEELIGCPLNRRRAELELALRLEDLLDSSPPTSNGSRD